MIKLDKKSSTFEKDLYKARIKEILTSWKLGRPVESGDESPTPLGDYRKDRNEDEDVAYVH